MSAIHQSFLLESNNRLDEFMMDHHLRHHVDRLREQNENLRGRLSNDESNNVRLKGREVEGRYRESAQSEAAVLSLGNSLRFLWEQLKQQTPPGGTKQKIITNLKPRDPSPSNDIVLVTHGSLFKLDTFLTQMEYWNGPASFAVYMNNLGGNPDAIDLLDTFLQHHREKLQNTSIHLFMEFTAAKHPLAYPHNPLRNLAMDQSDSDFIVALDVDFIPHPKDCYSKLTKTLTANNSSLANEIQINHRIMVLPAFEVYAPKGSQVASPNQLPTSKEALYESIQANHSEAFRIHRYPAGHGPTNFTKWFSPISNHVSSVKKPTNAFYPISYRPGFEPYVLAYRHGLPKYWNTFRGFGQNKLSWFMELHLAGYQFGSLWDFFVVHLQHPSTVSWKERHENIVRHEAFLSYLREQYPLKNHRKVKDKRFYFTFKNKPWRTNNATKGGEIPGNVTNQTTFEHLNERIPGNRNQTHHSESVMENNAEDSGEVDLMKENDGTSLDSNVPTVGDEDAQADDENVEQADHDEFEDVPDGSFEDVQR